MNTTIIASPMKLRDGSWGARVPSKDAVEGQTIRIRTRAGKEWDAVITRIQERKSWDNETHCATRGVDNAPAAAPAQRHRGTRTGCACGSVDEYSKPSDCWNCRHDR